MTNHNKLPELVTSSTPGKTSSLRYWVNEVKEVVEKTKEGYQLTKDDLKGALGILKERTDGHGKVEVVPTVHVNKKRTDGDGHTKMSHIHPPSAKKPQAAPKEAATKHREPKQTKNQSTAKPRTKTQPIRRTVSRKLQMDHPVPEPPQETVQDRIKAWEAEALVKEIELEGQEKTSLMQFDNTCRMLFDGNEEEFLALYNRFVDMHGEEGMDDGEMEDRFAEFLLATGHLN